MVDKNQIIISHRFNSENEFKFSRIIHKFEITHFKILKYIEKDNAYVFVYISDKSNLTISEALKKYRSNDIVSLNKKWYDQVAYEVQIKTDKKTHKAIDKLTNSFMQVDMANRMFLENDLYFKNYPNN